MPLDNARNMKRVIPPVKSEDRCTSVDPLHPHLQCLKHMHHPMNWHEAKDSDVVRTWVDPARHGRYRAPVDCPVSARSLFLDGQSIPA